MTIEQMAIRNPYKMTVSQKIGILCCIGSITKIKGEQIKYFFLTTIVLQSMCLFDLNCDRQFPV